MSCHASKDSASSADAHASVVVVIPTHRPPETLSELVAELSPLGPIVISDDCSPVTFDGILRGLSQPRVTVLRHSTNQGIARALNEGLAEAKHQGATWLLTLDQDSWLSSSSAQALLASGSQQSIDSARPVGVIGAGSVHLQGGATLYSPDTPNVHPVPEVIQSGSLWSVQALNSIGGFRTDFIMDAIDADACLRLRERGYSVLIDRKVEVNHCLGNVQPTRLLGRQILVTRHPPQRLRRMRRNRFRLFPAEFWQSPSNAMRTIRRVAINEVLSRWSRHGNN